MEPILLWLGINVLIGYALGKQKNEVGVSILICILLGPIGWLLCILNKGKVRKCPYCAEDVKPQAVVCRHCGRDLPQIVSGESPKGRKWEVIPTLLIVLTVVGGLWVYIDTQRTPVNYINQAKLNTGLSQLQEDTGRAQLKLKASTTTPTAP